MLALCLQLSVPNAFELGLDIVGVPDGWLHQVAERLELNG